MDFKPTELDYTVSALGMAWGILKDIQAEATALIRESIDPADLDKFDECKELADVTKAIENAGQLTRAFLPFLNDLQSEFRPVAMQTYVEGIQPHIGMLASRSAAFAMIVFENAEEPEYKERAQDILNRIGYFEPKGSHPYFR